MVDEVSPECISESTLIGYAEKIADLYNARGVEWVGIGAKQFEHIVNCDRCRDFIRAQVEAVLDVGS